MVEALPREVIHDRQNIRAGDEEEKKDEAARDNRPPIAIRARINRRHGYNGSFGDVSEKSDEEDSWVDESQRAAAADMSSQRDLMSGGEPNGSIDLPNIPQRSSSNPLREKATGGNAEVGI